MLVSSYPLYFLPTIQRIHEFQHILFIAFLVFSAIIGVLRYEVQNKHYDKKATFLTNKMAEQSLPLLPAMILGLVVVLITHKWVITIFFQIPDFCMI